jgi:hypothetical protein
MKRPALVLGGGAGDGQPVPRGAAGYSSSCSPAMKGSAPVLSFGG